MEATKEKCLPLSLIRALQMTTPNIMKSRRDQFLQKMMRDQGIPEQAWTTMSLVDLVTLHLEATEKLQKHFNMRWVVVKRVWYNQKTKETVLLYDGRQAILEEEKDSDIHYFLVDKKKRLKQHWVNNESQWPHLNSKNEPKKCILKKRHLWKLLGLDNVPEDEKENNTDPQTKADLMVYLKEHTPANTKVIVNYLVAPKKWGSGGGEAKHWCESQVMDHRAITNVLTLLAWSNKDYTVAYSEDIDPTLKTAQRRGKQVELDYARYKQTWEALKEQEKEASDPHQANSAACVSLLHSNLNLAFDLGIVSSQKELANLSFQLAATHSSLYVFLDEKFHLRHITYHDQESQFTTQVTCFEQNTAPSNCDSEMSSSDIDLDNQRREKATQTMLAFWQQVWQRRNYWVQRRRQLLKPLMDHLEHLLANVPLARGNQRQSAADSHSRQQKRPRQIPFSSPYSRCLADLHKTVHHHRIYMFSDQDAHLHSIKFFLADFIHQTMKKTRGVLIKATSDNTLTGLSVPGMSVINLHTYFDTKKDLDFFSSVLNNGRNPSDIVVAHTNKHLQLQKLPGAYTNHQAIKGVLGYCNATGKKCAQYILHYWSSFGLHLWDTFHFEVHGLSTYSSASFLAFQCVWTAYSKIAGPLAHALEKCKPYYEDLLRQSSKGGFMYSVEGALNQGDPLWPDNDAAAQAIVEMDLVSAYGFAATMAYTPSGFCTGFMSTNAKSASSNCLERLDKRSRHTSFEFKAVYKVLHDLVYIQGVKIRTVYSNFSPNGIFCLASYPIDLAIVTETGNLLLYQMDGQWAHGCVTCVRQPKSFVNGQTFDQVRNKTDCRDTNTLAWIKALNDAAAEMAATTTSVGSQQKQPKIQYTIICDCHTPGFSPGALDMHFQRTPALAQFVRGYCITDTLGNSFCPVMFEKALERTLKDASFTFIAKAKVIVVPEPTLPHPIREGPLVVYQQRQDMYTKNILDYSGEVILTRDYYNWLKKTNAHVFIEHLDWVLFYKTEPVFNQVYSALTQLRSATADPVLVSFLKRMINLSCGFYGARTSQKDKTTYRLVNGAPKNYAFYRHYMDMYNTMDLSGERTYFLLETKPWPKLFNYRKPTKSAIPMFLNIVEYGKLRLVQILHFIQCHVASSQFRLLYSNIDNVIFSLAGADTLPEAITDPKLQHSYLAKRKDFLIDCFWDHSATPAPTTTNTAAATTKCPGIAELKWIRNGPCGWKFITTRTQHYCLIMTEQEQNQENLHKTSGWSNLSSLEAYEAAQQILNGRCVKLVQHRRVNKRANMETRQVDFHYM